MTDDYNTRTAVRGLELRLNTIYDEIAERDGEIALLHSVLKSIGDADHSVGLRKRARAALKASQDRIGSRYSVPRG